MSMIVDEIVPYIWSTNFSRHVDRTWFLFDEQQRTWLLMINDSCSIITILWQKVDA